ncbi:putative amine oxidase [copper-containing] [Crassostrea virginica]
MDRSSIPKIALRWTPAGKRPRGRPKTTWRKTIENELKSLNLTWGEAEARAKNRAEWRHLVLTLCSNGSEEDRSRIVTLVTLGIKQTRFKYGTLMRERLYEAVADPEGVGAKRMPPPPKKIKMNFVVERRRDPSAGPKSPDLDIGGTMNSYSTYNVELDEAPNPFSKESPHSNMFQEKIVKVDYATERDAAYNFNFTAPKYHVFYNENNPDKYGNPRAYRLLAKGFAKQVLPEGVGNEPGASWTRYQIAVTKRKETEPYSSSKYASYDGENRTVDFEDFIGNESIQNEDLVAWVTLGVHHIPRTEDLPVMPTPGTEMSFLLMPFNYFSEDPSVGDKDNVRFHYESATGPLEMFIQNESNDLTCKPPKTYSVKDLTNHPEDFISRPRSYK